MEVVVLYDAEGNDYNVLDIYVSQFLAEGFTKEKPEEATPKVAPAKG